MVYLLLATPYKNIMENTDMRISKLNKELSKLLFRLFVTNTYAIAFQMPNGKYVTRYLPVSEYLIEEMLNQRGSIGCYQQCYKSNMLKWICFDFDSPDKENPDLKSLYEYNVKPLLQICDEYHIRYLTEFSGRRGIHIWIVFSHLIPKEKAFQILLFLKHKLLHQIKEFTNANLDPFPATSSSKGNIVGKQVKLPLSVHKSGKQSWLFQGPFNDVALDNRESFLRNQLQILKNYEVNDYETVIGEIGLNPDELVGRLKYIKYQIDRNLNLSIWDTIKILSETKVYSYIFERLMQGKAYRQDWIVVLGTFSPLKDGGRFVKELYSIFPNYDVKKTSDNISRYNDKYFPATFEYLYKIYGIDMENSLDKTDTGFNYLLKRNGIIPKVDNSSIIHIPKNESDIYVKDTLRKEIKYILDNDEVINISIWNRLNSFTNQDIYKLEKVVAEILSGKWEKNGWKPKATTYNRIESEEKKRLLVSLEAQDRVLTTHIALLLQSRLKKTWNSFSYNLSFCSREDIFYNWYSSWSEYLNRIKTFIEVPFMGNYEVFIIDLKSFYDHIDFLSVYIRFVEELNEEEKYLFKFLVNYNDQLMRKISGGKRKGVPQGPAYARIISEMYLDSVLASAFLKYDNSVYNLYRYVDDIIVFVKPGNCSYEIYNSLINTLISYGLPINEDKSFCYGVIKKLDEEQKRKILRKDKFTYDLQEGDYKGFVTLAERRKDIEQYIGENKFEVGDLSFYFSKRIYREASERIFDCYAPIIMKSSKGRGIAFRRFYEYLLTNSYAVYTALERNYFMKVPLNSINFGNFLGELYLLIQDQKIPQDIIERIQNEYLRKISDANLNDEYQVLVDSLKKIKIKREEEDVEGFSK